MTEQRAPGLAILCDRAGVIQQVLCDDFSSKETLTPGKLFSEWVDIGSHEKAIHLLEEVEALKSAFDWELNIAARGRLITLHFSGVAQAENLLIVAAQTRNGILQLYEELMRINNEQVNALRMAIKDQSERALAQNQRDNGIYDELSKLNNELIGLQRELSKKNIELERLNQQKNQFLGMAAHDLRSPLSAIMMYSEFLSQEISPLLNSEQKEFLDIIGASSQFMRGLVDDLLDVSAIEAGQLALNLQSTDLAQLVSHNISLNRMLASKQQKQVSYECAGEIPRVNVDPAKIVQVLNNLISNAVKYSFPNSTIHVNLKRDGEWLALSVQDHGQGIPAAEIDRLFKPFSRTSSKSTTGEKSTGLGLAIVYRIIQGHHGKIWVESKVGEGATFFVNLPVSGNQEYMDE